VEPVMVEGEYVSSSRVRSLLAAGDVDLACKLLTAPYRLRGIVVHGAGRGQKIGFPTANLQGVDTLLPGPGVYAGRGWLNGRFFPAAINVGPNPTFSESSLKLEVHLVGLAEPLYGRLLEVDFLSRLRDITAFASVAELTEQLRLDVASAVNIAGPPRS
jgi:riboflavin kinase/FMN adenylyltransferase